MQQKPPFFADYAALKERLAIAPTAPLPRLLVQQALGIDDAEWMRWDYWGRAPARTAEALMGFAKTSTHPVDIQKLAYLSNKQVEAALEVGPSFVVVHSDEGWFPLSRAEQVSRPLYRIRMDEVLNLISHYEATPLPHRLSAVHRKHGWPCAVHDCDSAPTDGSGGLCKRHDSLRRGKRFQAWPRRRRATWAQGKLSIIIAVTRLGLKAGDRADVSLSPWGDLYVGGTSPAGFAVVRRPKVTRPPGKQHTRVTMPVGELKLRRGDDLLMHNIAGRWLALSPLRYASSTAARVGGCTVAADGCTVIGRRAKRGTVFEASHWDIQTRGRVVVARAKQGSSIAQKLFDEVAHGERD